MNSLFLLNMAFISSLTLAPRATVLTRSTLCGASLSAVPAPVRATVRAQEMSPSVPFLPKPANLSKDLPGYAGFDPLGISNYVNIKFLQEAEIKHSRICMLAVLGIFVSEFYRFPFYSGAPQLAEGIHNWGVQQGCMKQLLFWVCMFEVVVGVPALVQMITLDSPRRPGEFAFDPLGLGKSDQAFKKNQNAELVNGRLAMIAVGGLIHQQWLTSMTSAQQIMQAKFMP